YQKHDDRFRHMYVIGGSGSGKSEFIAKMIEQDILAGFGVGVVDPHGDLVETALSCIPKERAEDVILFDPSDYDRPLGLNMLEAPSKEMQDYVVGEMIAIFYKLFPPEMIGPQFEHTMRNLMLTLMSDNSNPGTIAEIPRLITDAEYQKKWVAKVTDPVVRSYWENEVAKTSDFHKSEMFGYLISKVGRFVENAMMRNIIGQKESAFDFRDVMDNKKILLVNLSKGKIGDVNANLLGMVIVTKLQMAAMARADMPKEDRKDFFLYIDEFQNFVTPSIATILSEARKYRLSLIIAHQYIAQLAPKGDTEIRDAVIGNVGTKLAGRVGVDDAEFLEKEFGPTLTAYDLMNVDKIHWSTKLLIDNTISRPFVMKSPPMVVGNRRMAEAIRQLARLKYGRDRVLVEQEILERTKLEIKGMAQETDRTSSA
ncbi:MAG: type IV secretory system conjugative DNA transfer family protein, partial [bacterium]